jgi:hypothetical protein
MRADEKDRIIVSAAHTEALAMRLEAEGHHGTAAALYGMARDKWAAVDTEHGRQRRDECIEAAARCGREVDCDRYRIKAHMPVRVHMPSFTVSGIYPIGEAGASFNRRAREELRRQGMDSDETR